DLRGATLEGVKLRYAKLVGAKLDVGALDSLDTFGAAAARPAWPHPGVLPALQGCNSVAISPDGAWVAAGYEGGTVVLWSTANGEAVRAWPAHADGVTTVAFSRDTRLLASGSEDCTVRLWSLPDGGLLRSLRGKSGPVTSVTFSHDAKFLAT